MAKEATPFPVTDDLLLGEQQDDDILKYLLSDSPSSSDFSSPDGSPMLVLEDSPDSSPWGNDDSVMAPAEFQDVSIDLDTNADFLLYGTSTFTNTDFNSLPVVPASPPAVSTPQTHVPIVPAIAPATATSNIAADLIAPKKTRAKKRPRVSDPPPVPSPEKPDVALSRDTLLAISSQGMERYVENLTSTRSLTLDDQKELKRQKRLIKNRESAQLSRERKRAYIDQLEDKINQLVSENTALKNENVTLRQALSQYRPELAQTKAETLSDIVTRRPDPQAQHATKMGGLLTSAMTVGGNRAPSATTKAGVCLLVVLFTFGLFMNSSNPALRPPSGSSIVPIMPRVESPNILPYIERPVAYQRSILEVIDEDDVFDDPSKQLAGTERDQQLILVSQAKQVERPRIQHPMQVSPAGIYKVSYSPEPAKFLVTEPIQSKYTPETDENNSTYMLFLDPRPDFDNDGVPDPPQADLQVSTHTHVSKNVVSPAHHGLPPMIISLVVPNHIANGSNPLFPKDKDGFFSADSLMEITCQVVDISITTSERPKAN